MSALALRPPVDRTTKTSLHVGDMSANVSLTCHQHTSAGPSSQHVSKTSADMLLTCCLILLDINQIYQSLQKIMLQWHTLLQESHKMGMACINSHTKSIVFLKKWCYLGQCDGLLSHGYGVGSHGLIHQLTCDAATNQVTMLATFDVGWFSAANVEVRWHITDMLLACPT